MQTQNQAEKTTLEIYGEKIEQLDRIFTFTSSVEVKAKVLFQMVEICKRLEERGILELSTEIDENELKELYVHAILASSNFQIDAEAEIVKRLCQIESDLVLDCIEAGLIVRFYVPTEEVW